MAHGIELSESADRELNKLGAQSRKRILKFLHERAAKLDNPRSIGEALHGSRLGGFWKYRVGDYRLISKIVLRHASVETTQTHYIVIESQKMKRP